MKAAQANFLLRQAACRAASPWGRRWTPYTRLIVAGDRVGWVLDEETRDLRTACRAIGIRTAMGEWAGIARNQCVFYASQFVLLRPPPHHGHRRCLAYFHGRPGTGVPEFDEVFENLGRTHETWSRIQVSHRDMLETVRMSGIAPEKVHLIPIGVRLSAFPLRSPAGRLQARKELGIPDHAFVVGSFQKDGCGWGEGLEPKGIKGPDILVRTLRAVKDCIPGLWVLLCGPARGYVKRGLAEASIPFVHRVVRRYPDIAPLYRALDVCLVASRQEGGPKAVLESMASGVPLVSTRVGQAADLVCSGENGFLCPVEDVEALAHTVEQVVALGAAEHAALVTAGRRTAEEHAWARQGPLWKRFFEGIVD